MNATIVAYSSDAGGLLRLGDESSLPVGTVVPDRKGTYTDDCRQQNVNACSVFSIWASCIASEATVGSG